MHRLHDCGDGVQPGGSTPPNIDSSRIHGAARAAAGAMRGADQATDPWLQQGEPGRDTREGGHRPWPPGHPCNLPTPSQGLSHVPTPNDGPVPPSTTPDDALRAPLSAPDARTPRRVSHVPTPATPALSASRAAFDPANPTCSAGFPALCTTGVHRCCCRQGHRSTWT